MQPNGFETLSPPDTSQPETSVSVERLRAKGYGNAIVPQVAAAFITAFMEG